MKGVVFNLLERIVIREYGEDTWDELLDSAELHGSYTSLGSYPDADLSKLVGAASARLDTPPDEIVRWFGRNALPLFAENYPQLFERHSSTRTFVLTLNDIIHPEVRKLYPGADVPVFDFDPGPDGTLRMGYRSPRKLCSFAEGLLQGAAQHYGEQVAVEQPRCMKRGDERCVLEISFTANGATP
ncbi:MAG: heme NO-binding domain-containing protein [Thermoleophilaceae bacterium]|nr:heme NO-binding domain-containing protein [Thermoleophilaceae bacterium]